MLKRVTISTGNLRITYLKKDAKLLKLLLIHYKDVYHDSVKLFVKTAQPGESITLPDRANRKTIIEME